MALSPKLIFRWSYLNPTNHPDLTTPHPNVPLFDVRVGFHPQISMNIIENRSLKAAMEASENASFLKHEEQEDDNSFPLKLVKHVVVCH